ncbi:MAG: class I SAM-dependent methyltransferase [Verrucomicrobia bacterium]|nr:class I SAM-dependent methyltransferase [Verrucomicrobiota bacterium]
MKYRVIGLLAASALLGGVFQGGAAEKVARTYAEREAFIKQFHRIPLNTTPGDAMLLRILARASKAKRGVEVGSATGYGAINMGLAFEANGGRLYTIDIDPDMVRKCRENVRKMGLEKTVTVIEGDALKVLPRLEGMYDFVFIDAVKRDYFKYFKAIELKLTKGAVIVADNVIRSARQMQDFLSYFKGNEDYEMVIVRASMEKHDGMAVIYKLR